MEGRFSHGLTFCTKLIKALNTVEEIPTEESGLMTVEQFMESFEKKHARYLTTTHTRTYNEGRKTNEIRQTIQIMG